MRIATFNLQNLRLRRQDGAARLDGARDADDPDDGGPGPARLDRIDRRMTAAVLRDLDADVVALQEVFDRATLDHFHDRFLATAVAAPWPHRVCLPGNDGRGLDVAFLSRHPLEGIASHAALAAADLGLADPPGIPAGLPVFRRDCLVARVRGLTLLNCHFKAPTPDPEAAWPVRRLEAEAVRRLIERRFPRPGQALWLVLGDLNEPSRAMPGRPSAIEPLIRDFSVDLAARMPEGDRWTWHDPRSGRYAQPDALLASPALAAKWPDAVPFVLREGLGREAGRFRGPRLAGAGEHRPHASDHAALAIDLDGL